MLYQLSYTHRDPLAGALEKSTVPSNAVVLGAGQAPHRTAGALPGPSVVVDDVLSGGGPCRFAVRAGLGDEDGVAVVPKFGD